jgi:hypothetical protein
MAADLATVPVGSARARLRLFRRDDVVHERELSVDSQGYVDLSPHIPTDEIATFTVSFELKDAAGRGYAAHGATVVATD